jgi:MFS family permease
VRRSCLQPTQPIVLLSLASPGRLESGRRRNARVSGRLKVRHQVILGRQPTGHPGVGSAVALALVSDRARPGRRGEAIGVALGATSAGSIAGPALGGVTADLLSFAAPFLIVGGISVAIAVAATFLLPPERRTAPRTPAWATIRRSVGSGTGAVAGFRCSSCSSAE